MSEDQVQRISKRLAEFLAGRGENRFRQRTGVADELEKKLQAWLTSARENKKSVSTAELIDKAKELCDPARGGDPGLVPDKFGFT